MTINNYAFIDETNMYLSIKHLGWDYRLKN